MKYVWEESDFNSDNKWWGMLATCDDETVVISDLRVTSLRDGRSWSYESLECIVEKFNNEGFIPVFSQVNASVEIKKLQDRNFDIRGL